MAKALKNETNSKVSGKEQVDLYIKNLNNQQKELLTEVRKTILSANKELTEHIKWNAPSFCYDGDDRITTNVHKANMVMLIFHRGAKAKDRVGKKTLFEDKTGLLEWLSPDRAVIKLQSCEELKAKKKLLLQAVNQWIEATCKN